MVRARIADNRVEVFMDMAKRMKSSLWSIVVIGVLGFTASLAQAAAVYPLPSDSPGPVLNPDELTIFTGGVPTGPVNAAFYFQLDQTVNLKANLTQNELLGSISNLGFTLSGPGGFTAGGSNVTALDLSGLLEGAYKFDITGTASGIGIPVVALAASVVPVPLPAAAWLLISGLAGMGVVARRRRQAAVPA